MLHSLIILTVSLSFLSITILYKKHNFSSPLFISNMIWAGIAVISFFINHMFFELSSKILYIWLSWSLTLNFTLLLLTKKNPIRVRRIYTIALPNYWSYLLIFSAYMLYEIIKLGISGPHSFLLNIRLAKIFDHTPPVFSIFSRAYPLIFVLFLFEIILNNNKRNRYSTYIYTIIFVLLTAGKMAVIIPTISYVVAKSVREKIKPSKIMLLSIVILIIMLILHYLRKSHDDVTPLIQTLATYTYSPLIALGEIIPSSSEYWGENTFRFIYALGYNLGLSNIEPIQLILDYSYVPTPTNVYTAIYIFYKDFGIIGVILGAFAYGIIYSILYNLFSKNRLLSTVLYISILPPLFLTFFAEGVFTAFSFYLQVSFYTFLIGLIYARRKRRYSFSLLQRRKIYSQPNTLFVTANPH